MNMTIQTTWGHLVVWYLFLAGAGAGLYLIAIGCKLWKNNTSLAKMAYYTSPLLVTVGTLFLLLDLGQPLRAALAILRPHSSMISVGTLILALFMTVTFWQAYQAFRGHTTSTMLDYAGLCLALGTAAYTGLLLGVVKAIPFWNNPLLPILFVVSALSSGLGIILAWNGRTNQTGSTPGELLSSLFRLDAGLVAVEAVFITCWLLVAVNGSAASLVSAQFLLSGFLALPFWLVVIGAGVVTPIVLKITGRLASSGGSILCGISLLAGALALRYGVVLAGVWVPLY